jgi:hypothetical protein
MSMPEAEVLSMMRENAALCNLEAEVILALKANAVNDKHMLQKQIEAIVVCLQRVDDVRRRYDSRSQSQEEGS